MKIGLVKTCDILP